MIRLYLALGGIAAIAAIIGAVYFMGGQAAKDKARNDALQGTINNAEKFNEGASNPNGGSWFGRLFPDAPG